MLLGFPCGSADKESACNARDLGLSPGLESSHGEGKSYPLQYSDLYSPCGQEELDKAEGLSLSLSKVKKTSRRKSSLC